MATASSTGTSSRVRGAELGGQPGGEPAGLWLIPLRRQLLGDRDDASEDWGPGAGTAGGTARRALGVSGAVGLPGGAQGGWGSPCPCPQGALRDSRLPGPRGAGPQGARGACGRLGPGLRCVSGEQEGGRGVLAPLSRRTPPGMRC